MSFGMFATIVGLLLGLAAALDLVVHKPSKVAFAHTLRSLRTPITPAKFNITGYLDRLFGPRLGSLRAFKVSVILSLVSLSLAYLYAYITSEESVVSIFESNPTLNAILLFSLFLAGCIVGDFFSFAQTRIFLRSVDTAQHSVISVGLALADAVISLAIFVGVFSLTRMAAYLIVIGTSTGGVLQSEQIINLGATRHAVSSLVRDGVARPSELDLPLFIGNISSMRDASIADEVLRGYSSAVLGRGTDPAPLRLSVSFECEQDIRQALWSPRHTTSLIVREIAARRGIEPSSRSYENLLGDVERRVAEWVPSDTSCRYQLLRISQQLTPRSLLGIAGISNTFYASFERTFFDFYTNIGFKFSPYASVDPNRGVGEFYSSLIEQTRHGFLGVPGDPSISYLLSGFSYSQPERPEKLQIPFSPMLASALTVSIGFWIYILFIYSSRVAAVLQGALGKYVIIFDVDRAPFTVLGVATSALVGIVWVGFAGVGIIWRLLF